MKIAIAAIAACAALSSVASAATIAFNFVGRKAGGGSVIGTAFGIPEASWTNGTGATNSTGIVVGSTTVKWSARTTYGDTVNGDDGDETVYGGYLDDGTNTANPLGPSITLSGLATEYGGGLYKITLYSFSDNPANPIGEHRLAHGSDATVDVTGTTIASTGSLTGNYGITVFDNLSADTVTITGIKEPDGNDERETIAGFVIEAVPEPSSMAFLGLAGIALILRRRK